MKKIFGFLRTIAATLVIAMVLEIIPTGIFAKDTVQTQNQEILQQEQQTEPPQDGSSNGENPNVEQFTGKPAEIKYEIESERTILLAMMHSETTLLLQPVAEI
jgi:hypothetical protein